MILLFLASAAFCEVSQNAVGRKEEIYVSFLQSGIMPKQTSVPVQSRGEGHRGRKMGKEANLVLALVRQNHLKRKHSPSLRMGKHKAGAGWSGLTVVRSCLSSPWPGHSSEMVPSRDGIQPGAFAILCRVLPFGFSFKMFETAKKCRKR